MCGFVLGFARFLLASFVAFLLALLSSSFEIDLPRFSKILLKNAHTFLPLLKIAFVILSVSEISLFDYA